MKSVLLATVALLSVPAELAAEKEAAASDAEGAPPIEAVADTAVDDDAGARSERKVCRTQRATGSLTRRTRICLTQAQWREIHDRTRRGVDEMTSAASGGKECIVDQAGGCR